MTPAPFKNQSFRATTLNALRGVRLLWRENAVKRELLVILVSALVLGFYPGLLSLLLFVLAVLLLAFEAVNSAIETLCDHVTPQQHESIRDSKDLAAAAIFIISLLMAGIAVSFVYKEFWLNS